MELLELLEARVGALVAQIARLRAENARLEAQAAHDAVRCQSLQDEKLALHTALIQEQQLKDTVLERIDALLDRLKDVDSDV